MLVRRRNGGDVALLAADELSKGAAHLPTIKLADLEAQLEG